MPSPPPSRRWPRPSLGESRVGRRSVLAGLGLAVAGCTSPSAPQSRPQLSPAAPVDDKTLVWANWPAYLDKAKGSHPSLDAFTSESGVAVDYQTVINDNVEFMQTVEKELGAGASIGYDVITLTSWAAARLVAAGEVQPYQPLADTDRVVSALRGPAWDPEMRFAVPWQSGLTGIAYDARRVDRAIGSIAELFERPDLAGGVGMFTELNDTLGMVLLAQGESLTDLSEDLILESIDYLSARQQAGQFRGFYGNEYLTALDKGELSATLAWSGDILQAQLDNPYLKFVVPEEGLMIWSDELLVPMGSPRAETAAALVDYYYRPDVAAQVAAWVNYICPVVGAQEELAKIDPALAEDPLIFPDQSILDVAQSFPSLPADLLERVNAGFADLL